MVSKYNSFGLVIEKFDKLNNKTILENDILKWCESKGESLLFYAFILHDNDFNDSGELEREHYHLVVTFSNQYAIKTIISDIASSLIINVNCISCKGVMHFVNAVQYLIHKNNGVYIEGKTPYREYDVWCNDTNELLNILLDQTSTYDIDIDYLVKLVCDCKTLTEVYRKLGLKKSRSLRPIVKDLWLERYKV